MRVSYVGTGYVGLVSGAVSAEMGNKVICVDVPEKVKFLKSGGIPIYEPGLEEIVKREASSGNLEFSDSIPYAVKNSDIVFITVGTPSNNDGSVDLRYVFSAAEEIGKAIDNYKLVVVKSTVPPGTTAKIEEIIKRLTSNEFDTASNPEFLREGKAIEDTRRPDRVVVGVNSEKAERILRKFYGLSITDRNPNKYPFISMKPVEAEMVKYASNTALATRISFANQLANICNLVSADYKKVKEAMCLDKRIGNEFLEAGLGYAGSCFPKDVDALVRFSESLGYSPSLLKAVSDVNRYQTNLFLQKIRKYFGNSLAVFKDKNFAVWGLSFKPETDDIREAPSLRVIRHLIVNGAYVRCYDPKAKENAKKSLTKLLKLYDEPGHLGYLHKVVYCDKKEDAVKRSDALIICTEWPEFRKPDFEFLKKNMRVPVIFDGRNIYDPKELREKGFDYIGVGVSNI